MANTKAIKFSNNGYTYLPVTNSDIVQYSNQGISVTSAIQTLAASSQDTFIDGNESSAILHIKSVDETTVNKSYTFTGSAAGEGKSAVTVSYANNTITISATYTNTDTKVTSAANHYKGTINTAGSYNLSASGATAAWSIDVVKGVNLSYDAAGHITGMTITSGKIPANPVPTTNVVRDSTSWNAADYIVLTTATDKTIKKSTYKPTTTSPQSSSDNTTIPTSDAVYTAYTAGDTATLNAAKDYADSLVVSAMNYRGVSATALSDGATTSTLSINNENVTFDEDNAGDIVLDGTGLDKKEYIWNGTSWNELGDSSAKANKSTKIISGNTALTVTNPTLENDVTITHETSSAGTTNVTASNKNVTGTTGQQKVITSITVNSFGHVTSYTAANIYSTDTNTAIHNISGTSGKTNDASKTAVTNPYINVHTSPVNSGASAIQLLGSAGSAGKANVTVSGVPNTGVITISASYTDTNTALAKIGSKSSTNVPLYVGPNSTNSAAGTDGNTMTFVQGTNITLTPDTTNNKLTIAHTTPSGAAAKTSALYKIATDSQGHVTSATAASFGTAPTGLKYVTSTTDVEDFVLSGITFETTTMDLAKVFTPTVS